MGGLIVNSSRGNPVWPPAAATAARRDAPPAASAPAVYPLFSRLYRVFLPAMAFQQQEPVGQDRHRRVVVEASPGAALKVIQPQFFLHLLIPLLHRPAAFPQ